MLRYYKQIMSTNKPHANLVASDDEIKNNDKKKNK